MSEKIYHGKYKRYDKDGNVKIYDVSYKKILMSSETKDLKKNIRKAINKLSTEQLTKLKEFLEVIDAPEKA